MFKKYPKCFYVFVGEGNMKNMENISESVKVISKHFGRTRPSAFIVVGNFSTAEIKKFVESLINFPVVFYFNHKHCIPFNFFLKVFIECNGVCNDDVDSYFKIACPGSYGGLPNKIRINNYYKRVSTKKFEDICQDEKIPARIVYKYKNIYNFHVINGTMQDFYEGGKGSRHMKIYPSLPIFY